MELRLLSNENDRRIFAARTEQIRAKHGVGFKERSRSRLARIHLTFGNLYALFENDGDPAEKMIAGLVMHDLEMFPQTCPRPDLSHLPPRSVIEVSELWSRAIGAGALARAGAAMLVSQAQVHRQMERIDYQTLHDPLTNLPNREVKAGTRR